MHNVKLEECMFQKLLYHDILIFYVIKYFLQNNISPFTYKNTIKGCVAPPLHLFQGPCEETISAGRLSPCDFLVSALGSWGYRGLLCASTESFIKLLLWKATN